MRTLDADDFAKTMHRRESFAVFASLCIPLLSSKGLLLPFGLQHFPGGSGAPTVPCQSKPCANVNELQKVRIEVQPISAGADKYNQTPNSQSFDAMAHQFAGIVLVKDTAFRCCIIIRILVVPVMPTFSHGNESREAALARVAFHCVAPVTPDVCSAVHRPRGVEANAPTQAACEA